VDEARLEDSDSGLAPTGEGWFVVNVRDARWWTSETRGSGWLLEWGDVWFKQLGVNLTVLEPGQPNGKYHSEATQEAFLVLHGECRLLVEGEERVLRQWDFFHSPAGTEHIFVGAGDGPCAILMLGPRVEDEQLHYPVSELAARYDASVDIGTSDPDEAYAGAEQPRLGKPASWDQLPWA
jgi:uncharacterized cupin superfamily protein